MLLSVLCWIYAVSDMLCLLFRGYDPRTTEHPENAKNAKNAKSAKSAKNAKISNVGDSCIYQLQ